MTKYYKHPKYGITYSDKPFVTPPVRLCWPYLTKPKDPPPPAPGQQPGIPSYEVTLLFPKDSEAHVNWLKAINAKLKDMLKTFNQGRDIEIAKVSPAKDGDDPKWDKEKYPYYKGQYIVVARSTKLPTYANALREPADPALIVGGVLVCCVVTPKICASGVTYGLEAVQLWKDDGVRFGGGTRASTDYLKMLDVSDAGGEEHLSGDNESKPKTDAFDSDELSSDELSSDEVETPSAKKKAKAIEEEEDIEEAATKAIGNGKAKLKKAKPSIADLL